MTIEMLYGKIHRATVTEANAGYVGSITIDPDLIEAAGFLPGQRIDIVNVGNGERVSTYILEGIRGNKDICLNGGVARKGVVGDTIIVLGYASVTKEEAKSLKPNIVIVNKDNSIKEIKDHV